MKTLLSIKSFLTAVAKAVGLIVALVLSILFYIVIVGPYSLVVRIALRDPMDLETDPKIPTYWRALKPKRPVIRRPF